MGKDYQFKNPGTLGKWDLLNKLSEAVDQGDAATPSEIINILLIVLNDEQLEKLQKDLKRYIKLNLTLNSWDSISLLFFFAWFLELGEIIHQEQNQQET